MLCLGGLLVSSYSLVFGGVGEDVHVCSGDKVFAEPDCARRRG